MVIRQADKGGSVVVMNAEDYKLESLGQLNNATTYRTLKTNPTKAFRQQLSHLLDTGVETWVLTAEFLLVDNPMVTGFLHLPKLYKNIVPVQGHPIVAGIGSLFENLGHWIGQYLQPLVLRLPGYFRDTSVVLANTMDIQWRSSYQWITIDIRSLYSCIPHELTLEALGFHLQQYSTYP